MVSVSLLALALAPLAVAQYGGGGGGSGGSSSAAGAAPTSSAPAPALPTAIPSGTHAVAVGKDGFVFTPNNLTVPVNDTVEFFFYPIAHGVVQANFDAPCHPANTSAFSSGFMPVTSGIGAKSFKLKVNNTAPIWFYCPQTVKSHCQSGMVGVINPPSGGSQSLAAFMASAKNANASTMPANIQGGIVGTADGVSSSSSASAASASPSGGAGTPNAVVAGGSVFGALMALFGLFL